MGKNIHVYTSIYIYMCVETSAREITADRTEEINRALSTKKQQQS